MPHRLRTGREGGIDIEGLQLAVGNPTRFDYLVNRSDVVTSGMKPDAEINVHVSRLVSVLWNLVRVDSHQCQAKESKVGDAGLLKYLSTRSVLDGEILRFEMSSGLEPPAKLAVMNKQQFLSIRRQYECRGCEVSGIELRPWPHGPSVAQDRQRKLMGRCIPVRHVTTHEGFQISFKRRSHSE